ncbi:MAG: HD domain-containing protein [Thermodesulfobacteriota bacterium]
MIEEMDMMPHIVAHSEQVCRVALCLVDHMNHSSARLNRPLVQAAALLHDITKTRSFETGEDHAFTGKEMLKERGFPEVARVVGQHVHLENEVRDEEMDEARVVNYADKRVLHDAVVSLEKRMAYIVERYGREEAHRERIMRLWEESRELEERIFRHVKFTPGELTQYLSTE